MSSTPYSGATHVLESQSQKTVTINAALDRLDGSANAPTSVSVTGDFVIPEATLRTSRHLVFGGTAEAEFVVVTVPAVTKEFTVHNATDRTLIFRHGLSAAASTVYPGGRQVLRCDGVDVISLAPDGALTARRSDGSISIELSGDYGIPTHVFQSNRVLQFTGALSATATITVPVVEREFVVVNKTNKSIQIYQEGHTIGSLHVSVAAGGISICRAESGSVFRLAPDANDSGIALRDLTDVEVSGLSGYQILYYDPVVSTWKNGNPPQPWDAYFGMPGRPAAAEVLARIPMVRRVTFPAGMSGSRALAAVASTAGAEFSLRKSTSPGSTGTQFGTVNFSAGLANASFSVTIDTVFEVGDILIVTAPGSQDATLSDVAFSLVGSR